MTTATIINNFESWHRLAYPRCKSSLRPGDTCSHYRWFKAGELAALDGWAHDRSRIIAWHQQAHPGCRSSVSAKLNDRCGPWQAFLWGSWLTEHPNGHDNAQ